ncbi:type II toxin-antitoxin system Phd/YefM family antitoxin [Parafrankia soli]|uniref:type II toxin-antitoxin system Phd/YefM family antitoxin n=1 Tax=Parafrankia soli TaxID=2599596 RepID=UPI0008D8F283|nr:type II toxin-antitoxin system prevent-host-death family antitoxin [Parafrankia soli]
MDEIGLREVRQNASDLIRRAQAGERLTITVAGRPAAVLGPVSPRVWRHWDDLAELFAQPEDTDWHEDRNLVDGSLTDPWESR